MNGNLADLPSLDNLFTDPAKIFLLPPEVARILLPGVGGIHSALLAQSSRDTSKADSPSTPERWLTVEQASEMFGVTPQWLKKNKKRLPYSQPSRKKLVFPEEKLRRWFATQKAN
jgi:hypothetical protein